MSRTYKQNSKYQPKVDRRRARAAAASAPRRGELRLRRLGRTAVDRAAAEAHAGADHPGAKRATPRPSRMNSEPADD